MIGVCVIGVCLIAVCVVAVCVVAVDAMLEQAARPLAVGSSVRI